MLGVRDATELANDPWTGILLKAALPSSPEVFFDRSGPMAVKPDSRRAYHRFFLRAQAVLRGREEDYGVYVKDISRVGLGFLSPRQLLPRQRVRLDLSEGKTFELQITRCRRIREQCYECGGLFVLTS